MSLSYALCSSTLLLAALLAPTGQEAGASSQDQQPPADQAPEDPKAEPSPQAPQGQETRRSWRVYSIDVSRRLFAACDVDGDDRISYFEARKTIFAAKDRSGFRSFDTSSDGQIEFDEFDRRFRALTEMGQPLFLQGDALLRLDRGLETPRVTAPVLQRFFTSLDANQDDRISASEWRDMNALLQPLLGADAAQSFRELDKDSSGHISLEELSPLEDKLAVLTNALRKPETGRQLRPLPEKYRGADRNGDSLLDQDEFAFALTRIHPSLARHGAALLRQADQNRDNALDAIELRRVLQPRKPRTPR
jgi:Ca2+-binding EF-hand superfamily protein